MLTVTEEDEGRDSDLIGAAVVDVVGGRPLT